MLGLGSDLIAGDDRNNGTIGGDGCHELGQGRRQRAGTENLLGVDVHPVST
jgi:hypothetical protein